MKTNDVSYGNKLKQLFEDLRKYWLEKVPQIVSNTTEEPLYRLFLPLDSKSTLCFFAAPNELISMYRSYIFPIFERYGLTPIIANDITSHNENIMAVTASLIERAIMVIVDISSTTLSYKFEIDLALSKNRRITMIREKGSFIDPSVVDRGIRIFDRPSSADSEEFMMFIAKLEAYVQEEALVIIPQLSSEPVRLLNKGEDRSAVISAFILLEAALRERLQDTVHDRDKLSIRRLLDLAKQFNYVDNDQYGMLLSWIPIRNKLVHTNEGINHQDASKIVHGIQNILEFVRTKPRILNEVDRKILGTRYFKSLCEKKDEHDDKSTFSKTEIYELTQLGAYNKEIVIPLIINKLKQLNYIVEDINERISLTDLGKRHCNEEVVLNKSI